VAGYSGDASDAMAAPAHSNLYANGRKFSAPGSDNDINPSGNCADLNGGTAWCTSRTHSPVITSIHLYWLQPQELDHL